MSIALSQAETPSGRLIAFRSDRLGARLVSLMNAMRLAEDLGVDFQCAWIDTTGVGHVFNDPTELFKPGFVKRHFVFAEEWRDIRPGAENLSGQLQAQPDRVQDILASGQDMIVGNAFGVITLKGEDPQEITRSFRAQFGKIPFATPVLDAMSELDKALAGHTAYHIRRGDLTDDPKAKHKPWPHKMVPNEFYERHMQGALSDKGAIIFSDDAPTIAHYRTKFPHLKTIADLIDMDALTEAQRDLFELYAMSRCATIVAPERSAFSSTAADLTGARKVAVTDDLGDTGMAEAQQALQNRVLEQADSFSGDGDIGQSLAHCGNWLEAQGRWAEAAHLFATAIGQGLNISFVYPQAMRFQHMAGDASGVLRTANHMANRSVIFIKDQATAEILHGYAHLRLGDLDTARRHITNGFWHAPSVPVARSIVPLMVESGLLGPDVFIPATSLQLDLQRRRGPLKLLFQEFQDLMIYPGVAIPPALGSMDLTVWDWAPLMRAISFSALNRQGTIEQAAERLGNADDSREKASQIAVLRAFAGDPEAAADDLAKLAEAPDADAMTWQRLSHAWWLGRRFRRAARAAQEAVVRDPGKMAMQAWAGMTALRVREAEQALDHLDRALSAGTGLPSVAFLRAKALDRLKRTKEATEAAEAALNLAPLEVEYAMVAADLMARQDRSDEAIAILTRLVDAQRAPGKLFVQLIDLLNRTGHQGRAAEMTETAQTRAPKHPAFAADDDDEPAED